MPKFRILRRVVAEFVIAGLVMVAGCADSDIFPSSSLTVPPDAVDDAVLTYYPSAQSAVLSWTAPRPNGGTTEMVRYDIRYGYGDAFEWDRALEVPDPPEPADAGRRQSYRFDSVEPGRTLNASLRVIDASGNVSNAGNVATLPVPGFRIEGIARDALSGQGIAGLIVVYDAGAATSACSTGAGGRFVLDGLPVSDGALRVSSLHSQDAYFPLVEKFLVSRDSAIAFDMIPFAQSVVAPYLSFLAIFKTAVGVGSKDEILRKWPSFPVDLYVPEYVNAYGIDYGGAAVAAAERWMELTGVPLFRFVDTPPTTGVEMRYRTPQEMGIQIGYAVHTNTADGTPLRTVIHIVNSFPSPVSLNRTLLHELGHAIRLYHLPAGFLMFAGQPLPDDPTVDEGRIVQLLHALPDRTDLSIYHEVGE